MEPVGREIFWNVGQTARWIAYVLMVISFVMLVYGLKMRYAHVEDGEARAFCLLPSGCGRG